MSLQDKCDLGATTSVVTGHLHPPLCCWVSRAVGGRDWQELLTAGNPPASRPWCLNNVDTEGTSPWGALNHIMEKDQIFQSQANMPVTQSRLSEVPLGPGCSVTSRGASIFDI